MTGPKYIRHPALPFSIVKWEEETGFVYITAGGITDVKRSASIQVAELLERQDFLARLPADQVERVRAIAAKLATAAPSEPPQSSSGPEVSVSVMEDTELDDKIYEATRNYKAALVETCTVYKGTMEALIALGVAAHEQFPTGENGTQYWSKSGGCKGHKKNPSQRWSVRRHHSKDELDLFDVYRWHERRPIGHAFQRFMVRAMQPAQ